MLSKGQARLPYAYKQAVHAEDVFEQIGHNMQFGRTRQLSTYLRRRENFMPALVVSVFVT